MDGMATVVVVKVPDRDEEFRIPGDDFFVDDEGQLLVFLTAEDDEDPKVRAQFALYSYVYLEDEEEDEDELEYALNVARRHGFFIDDPIGGLGDDPDEDDEEDEDDEDESDEDIDEDDAQEAVSTKITVGRLNTFVLDVDALGGEDQPEESVLVAPVLVAPSEPESNSFSPAPSSGA